MAIRQEMRIYLQILSILIIVLFLVEITTVAYTKADRLDPELGHWFRDNFDIYVAVVNRGPLYPEITGEEPIYNFFSNLEGDFLRLFRDGVTPNYMYRDILENIFPGIAIQSRRNLYLYEPYFLTTLITGDDGPFDPLRLYKIYRISNSSKISLPLGEGAIVFIAPKDRGLEYFRALLTGSPLSQDIIQEYDNLVSQIAQHIGRDRPYPFLRFRAETSAFALYLPTRSQYQLPILNATSTSSWPAYQANDEMSSTYLQRFGPPSTLASPGSFLNISTWETLDAILKGLETGEAYIGGEAVPIDGSTINGELYLRFLESYLLDRYSGLTMDNILVRGYDEIRYIFINTTIVVPDTRSGSEQPFLLAEGTLNTDTMQNLFRAVIPNPYSVSTLGRIEIAISLGEVDKAKFIVELEVEEPRYNIFTERIEDVFTGTDTKILDINSKYRVEIQFHKSIYMLYKSSIDGYNPDGTVTLKGRILIESEVVRWEKLIIRNEFLEEYIENQNPNYLLIGYREPKGIIDGEATLTLSTSTEIEIEARIGGLLPNPIFPGNYLDVETRFDSRLKIDMYSNLISELYEYALSPLITLYAYLYLPVIPVENQQGGGRVEYVEFPLTLPPEIYFDYMEGGYETLVDIGRSKVSYLNATIHYLDEELGNVDELEITYQTVIQPHDFLPSVPVFIGVPFFEQSRSHLVGTGEIGGVTYLLYTNNFYLTIFNQRENLALNELDYLEDNSIDLTNVTHYENHIYSKEVRGFLKSLLFFRFYESRFEGVAFSPYWGSYRTYDNFDYTLSTYTYRTGGPSQFEDFIPYVIHPVIRMVGDVITPREEGYGEIYADRIKMELYLPFQRRYITISGKFPEHLKDVYDFYRGVRTFWITGYLDLREGDIKGPYQHANSSQLYFVPHLAALDGWFIYPLERIVERLQRENSSSYTGAISKIPFIDPLIGSSGYKPAYFTPDLKGIIEFLGINDGFLKSRYTFGKPGEIYIEEVIYVGRAHKALEDYFRDDPLLLTTNLAVMDTIYTFIFFNPYKLGDWDKIEGEDILPLISSLTSYVGELGNYIILFIGDAGAPSEVVPPIHQKITIFVDEYVFPGQTVEMIIHVSRVEGGNETPLPAERVLISAYIPFLTPFYKVNVTITPLEGFTDSVGVFRANITIPSIEEFEEYLETAKINWTIFRPKEIVPVMITVATEERVASTTTNILLKHSVIRIDIWDIDILHLDYDTDVVLFDTPMPVPTREPLAIDKSIEIPHPRGGAGVITSNMTIYVKDAETNTILEYEEIEYSEISFVIPTTYQDRNITEVYISYRLDIQYTYGGETRKLSVYLRKTPYVINLTDKKVIPLSIDVPLSIFRKYMYILISLAGYNSEFSRILWDPTIVAAPIANTLEVFYSAATDILYTIGDADIYPKSGVGGAITEPLRNLILFQAETSKLLRDFIRDHKQFKLSLYTPMAFTLLVALNERFSKLDATESGYLFDPVAGLLAEFTEPSSEWNKLAIILVWLYIIAGTFKDVALFAEVTGRIFSIWIMLKKVLDLIIKPLSIFLETRKPIETFILAELPFIKRFVKFKVDKEKGFRYGYIPFVENLYGFIKSEVKTLKIGSLVLESNILTMATLIPKEIIIKLEEIFGRTDNIYTIELIYGSLSYLSAIFFKTTRFAYALLTGQFIGDMVFEYLLQLSLLIVSFILTSGYLLYTNMITYYLSKRYDDIATKKTFYKAMNDAKIVANTISGIRFVARILSTIVGLIVSDIRGLDGIVFELKKINVRNKWAKAIIDLFKGIGQDILDAATNMYSKIFKLTGEAFEILKEGTLRMYFLLSVFFFLNYLASMTTPILFLYILTGGLMNVIQPQLFLYEEAFNRIKDILNIDTGGETERSINEHSIRIKGVENRLIKDGLRKIDIEGYEVLRSRFIEFISEARGGRYNLTEYMALNHELGILYDEFIGRYTYLQGENVLTQTERILVQNLISDYTVSASILAHIIMEKLLTAEPLEQDYELALNTVDKLVNRSMALDAVLTELGAPKDAKPPVYIIPNVFVQVMDSEETKLELIVWNRDVKPHTVYITLWNDGPFEVDRAFHVVRVAPNSTKTIEVSITKIGDIRLPAYIEIEAEVEGLSKITLTTNIAVVEDVGQPIFMDYGWIRIYSTSYAAPLTNNQIYVDEMIWMAVSLPVDDPYSVRFTYQGRELDYVVFEIFGGFVYILRFDGPITGVINIEY